MTNGNKLFRWRDPYDAAGTQALFAAAMAENARFQAGHCPDYARIFSQTDGSFAALALSSHGFSSSPKISVRNVSTISAARLCISPVVWV